MSFAEIKAELAKLTPEERRALAREIELLEPFSSPAFIAEMTLQVDDAERGEHLITKDELYRRLRAAGRAF